jgi:NADH:ubiquinone oxidoreductase subunit 2 (subunit N)
MNAPLFFMLAPLCLAVPLLYYYPRRPRGAVLFATVCCGFLCVFSSFLPLDQPLSILGFLIPVAHTFSLAGRDFSFHPALRPILAFLYFFVSVFFLGGLVIRLDKLFLPVGLLTLSLFSAAFFVQPFLYAAFFLFFSASLFSVLLSTGSCSHVRASIRFLEFSLLSVPFLVLAGSYFALSSGSAPDPSALRTSLILLGFGFLLLLTIPPMHAWQLDAADTANSYSLFFILAIYPTAIIFLLLRFINDFDWLRFSPLVSQGLFWVGIFLCIIGSIFSLIQNRLGRLILYLSMIQLGFLFISLSFHSPDGLVIGFSILAVRIFLFLLCGLSLFELHKFFPDDRFDRIPDLFNRLPMTCISLVLSLLSLVGFPGFLSFPSFWGTLRLLSLQPANIEISTAILLITTVTGALAVFNAVRFLLPIAKNLKFLAVESKAFQAIMFFCILLLLVFSWFPQFFIPIIANATATISTVWK